MAQNVMWCFTIPVQSGIMATCVFSTKGLLKNYRPANGKRFLVLCGPMCEIGPSAEMTTTSWLTGETPSPALQTRGCNFATLVCHCVSRSVFIHYVKALH